MKLQELLNKLSYIYINITKLSIWIIMFILIITIYIELNQKPIAVNQNEKDIETGFNIETYLIEKEKKIVTDIHSISYKAVANEGYTDIKRTFYEPFICSWDDSTVYSDTYFATNKDGKTVKIQSCCSAEYKACGITLIN